MKKLISCRGTYGGGFSPRRQVYVGEKPSPDASDVDQEAAEAREAVLQETRDKLDQLRASILPWPRKDQVQPSVPPVPSGALSPESPVQPPEKPSWMENSIEWLQDKLSGGNNSVMSALVILLDHLLDYVRPDENGKNTREDLITLAKERGKEQDGEKALRKLEREKIMLHKNNTVEQFKNAVEYRKTVDGVNQEIYGKNLEFDLRWSGTELVVRHNDIAKDPEVTLAQYIEVMKANPGWKRKIEFDVKDRDAFQELQKVWNQIPTNFQNGIMIGTFDPKVVEQVGSYNDGHPESKIPIILHLFPLMRYKNVQAAKNAITGFNQYRGYIPDCLSNKDPDALVKDPSNDPLASAENAYLYTSYAEFEADEKTTGKPQAEHMILALENPLLELPRTVIDAVLNSGGQFSMPYDPKYLQWIKDNATTTNVDFSHISVGFAADSYDDLYDAMRWRDKKGNQIARLSTDMKNI